MARVNITVQQVYGHAGMCFRRTQKTDDAMVGRALIHRNEPHGPRRPKTSLGGASWSDLSGATSHLLTITNMVAPAAGDYRVVVTDNNSNVLASDVSTLTIDLVPRITTTSLADATEGEAHGPVTLLPKRTMGLRRRSGR